MSNRGFTLLESIVALVILSLVAMSVFTWVGQSSRSVDQLLQRESQRNLEANLLALARIINPRTQPSGSLTIGAHVISWQAQRKIAADTLLSSEAMIDQDLALYTLVFKVVNTDGTVLVEEFATDTTGYFRTVETA